MFEESRDGDWQGIPKTTHKNGRYCDDETAVERFQVLNLLFFFSYKRAEIIEYYK